MAELPQPDFVERDPAAITLQVMAALEHLVGREIFPGQVESIVADLIGYRESLVRMAIQQAALQNLVAFASFPMLDFLGELVGVERLPAAPAATHLRFTLSAAQPAPVLIPAGTVATPAGTDAAFETLDDLTIAAGSLWGETLAEAQEPGTTRNGFLPGAINSLLAPIAYVASVANVDTSTGGADAEDDERLRERIRLAPATFSVAGSAAAYRAHALSAHVDVSDVAVTSPVPGTVRLTVLARGGVPSLVMLDTVEAAVSSDRVRPLTDTVEVVAPTRVGYSIEAWVRPRSDADPATTLALAQAAAEAFAAEQRASLGRSIVRSQLVAALMVDGAYSVSLTEPAEQELDPTEWADCESITLELA